MKALQFICSLDSWSFGLFSKFFLTVVVTINQAAMNILVHLLCTYAFSSSGFLKMKLMDQSVDIIFVDTAE